MSDSAKRDTAKREPFLSVIVRTQGQRAVSLSEAVGSLLVQADDDLEIVVVAHGDGSVAQRVQSQVGDRTKVITKTGGGRAAPLNAGLEAAKGRYVAFLDDDDLALPNWASTFRHGAESSPGAVVRTACLSQAWSASPDGEPLEALGQPESEFPAEFDLVAHFHSNATPICSFAVPRAGLLKAGISFDESLTVLEDWDFLLRCILAFGIDNSETQTAIYRRVDRGNSFSESDQVWIEAKRAVLAKLDGQPLVLPTGSASVLAKSHQDKLDLAYQLGAAGSKASLLSQRLGRIWPR